MSFDARSLPVAPRCGTDAHRSALERLADAREERATRSRAALSAAPDSAGQARTASELAAADERVAAREAWVAWIERGY